MWKFPPGGLPTFLLLWPLFQVHAANFTFNYGPGTQCDDFQVSWKGGVAPFRLTFVPSYATPTTVDIPSNAFSNNQGTFSTTLTIAQKQEFLAVMSDSSGFASGGVSQVITVGASKSGNQCNTTYPSIDFSFSTPSALQQCSKYVFNGWTQTAVVQPLTIIGLVPGGSSFILNPPSYSTSYTWVADIAAGSTVGFFMQDANGHQGGTTQFLPVAQSGDATCLDNNSPTSVSNAPSMTSTRSSAKATGSNSSSDSDSTSSSNGGTIAAAIAGTAVALLVVGTLIWFYVRRRKGGPSFNSAYFRRRFQKQEVDLLKAESNLPPPASLSPYPLYHRHDASGTPDSSSNLMPRQSDAASGFGPAPSANYADPPNSAFSSQFPSSSRPGTAPGSSLYGGESASGYGGGYSDSPFGYGASAVTAAAAACAEGSAGSWDQSTSSAARRKAAQAGVPTYQAPARYILHTDIEDDAPPPVEEEVIELPPQYTERRAPLPPTSVGSSGTSRSPHGLPYDSQPS